MNLVAKCLFFLAGVLMALNIAAFSLIFFPEVGIDRHVRTIERHHHYYYFYIPEGGGSGSPGNPPGG